MYKCVDIDKIKDSARVYSILTTQDLINLLDFNPNENIWKPMNWWKHIISLIMFEYRFDNYMDKCCEDKYLRSMFDIIYKDDVNFIKNGTLYKLK